MKVNWFLVLCILFLMNHRGYAQEKCATVPYNQNLQFKDSDNIRENAFEKWIANKKQERKLIPKILSTQEEPVYFIPVVIHVIYYKDFEGIEVGNLTEEQIFSQINVLNEDYRRMNQDTLDTPEWFLPVAADTRIEFRLAQRDPNGAPTTGIVRIEGPKTSWNANLPADDVLLKSLSFWPPEDYLNIWIVNLSGDFLGYAQYPQTDLPGTLPPFNRETDGVVIDYQVFGSIDKGSFPNIRLNYDRGRTTTHEIGHFLGLRHIWGDSDVCGVTDYCEDTPDQETSYDSCTGILGFSCDSEDMYQNYMDYTYDACMNLFTVDQMERMRIVLENSPRRASLLTSPGLIPPDTISNILIVREITNPTDISCESVFNPAIILQNIGNNSIADFEVEVTLNENTFPSVRYDLPISTGGSIELNFSGEMGMIELEKGQHFVKFQIKNPNGVDTINYPGKSASKYFVSSSIEEEVPYREKFSQNDFQNSSWVSFNPDNSITWESGSVPLNKEANNAAFIKMYDYRFTDQKDWLISPIFDFSDAPDASITFDYSYARYDSTKNDLLEILLSIDCGRSFPFTVFSANSDQMALRDFANPWVPLVSTDWKRQYVSLTEFAGLENVRLAFRTTNGYGNNLYIDNIEFYITGFSEYLILEENSIRIHPNPSTSGSFYVTLNTEERQPVNIAVINLLGKQLVEKQLNPALNQTVEFDLAGHANGIYLIQVKGTTFRQAARLLINK